MKKNTLVGIGAAVTCVLLAFMLDHDNILVLLNPTALVLVIGGTTALAFSVGTLDEAKSLPKIMKKAITGVPDDPMRIVEKLVEMAAVARKDGLLSLEQIAKEEQDPFFRQGVGLVVDGRDAETIKQVLEGDLESTAERHAQRAQILKQAGGFAPTLGIIGTVVGLVHVMTDISSPSTLGPAIGAAFTATLWGVLSANLFWHPMAAKLVRLAEAEVAIKEVVIDGLLAIQAGERPSVVRSLLEPRLGSAPQSQSAEAEQPEQMQEAAA